MFFYAFNPLVPPKPLVGGQTTFITIPGCINPEHTPWCPPNFTFTGTRDVKWRNMFVVIKIVAGYVVNH